MLRVSLLLVLLFALLLVLRTARIFVATLSGTSRRGVGPVIEAEMVRDPVCGTWIDRRLALTARRGAERVAVCSEVCRGQLQAQG